MPSETGEPIYVLIGSRGPVQMGKSLTRTRSPSGPLPKGVNIENLTLEMAVGLLSHPVPWAFIQAAAAKSRRGWDRLVLMWFMTREGGEIDRSRLADDVFSILGTCLRTTG